MVYRTAVVVILFGVASLVTCHPQCLDFRPPFRSNKVDFCQQYKDFGCCSKTQDNAIKARFETIMSEINANQKNECSSYLKELLCQKCSPYAAHIYSAEQTLQASSFPGLCPEYCLTLHAKCKDVIKYLTNDQQILAALDSVNTFCLLVKLTDVDYCYPDLLQNQNLNFNISIQQITSKGCLCVEEFAWNLRSPLLARHAGDGSGRLFIAEQRGVVYVYYKNKTRERRAFLDIKDRVLHTAYIADERGFLGLTFHPQFVRNLKFYVYYSARLPGYRKECIRVSEFRVYRKNKNRANRKSERVILEVEQPYANHNGGEILFGDDGYLYIFVGDGGSGGDPHGFSQNKSVLLGKVLRIDVDRFTDDKNYSIPADNPFVNESKSRPEIYALGIRNIWRCDKDEGDRITGEHKGRIICGDVGQDAYEEIDILYKGANYGWNGREGYQCYHPKFCGKVVPEELPIFSYPHTIGKSVTGGHVYRGCESPNLNGVYIYGDFTNGRLFRLYENKTMQMWVNKEIFMCGNDVCMNGLQGHYVPYILSFGEDENGEIYMLSTGMPSAKIRSGRVYKIVDPIRRGDPELCTSRFLGAESVLASFANSTGESWSDESDNDEYLEDYGSGECLDPSGYVCTPDQFPPDISDNESESGSGLESGSGSGNESISGSDRLDREYDGKNETSTSAETDIYIEPAGENTSDNGSSISESSRKENLSISTDSWNQIAPTLVTEFITTSKPDPTPSVLSSSDHTPGEMSGSGDSASGSGLMSGSGGDMSGSGELLSGSGGLSGSGELSGEGSGRDYRESSKDSESNNDNDFFVESSTASVMTTVQPQTTKRDFIRVKFSSSPQPHLAAMSELQNGKTIEKSPEKLRIDCPSGNCLEHSGSACPSGDCSTQSGSGCSSGDCLSGSGSGCLSGDCLSGSGSGCSSGDCSNISGSGCSSGSDCSNSDSTEHSKAAFNAKLLMTIG